MFLRSSFLLFNFISYRFISRAHPFFYSSTRKTTRLTKQESLLHLQNCKSMKDLKQIQSQMFRAGFHQNKDALNKLMVFCTDPDSGNLQYAERIFNYILEPSLFLYNLIIKAFVKKGNFKKAVLLFAGLRENGLSPDNFTYPFVLKAIGCLREFIEGRKVHGFIVKTGLEFDSFVRNSLMDMYSEMGYTETLQQLFEEMTERDVVTWNVLISGYVRSGRFENALVVFRRMSREASDRPDEATVVSTLSACVALGYLEQGKEIHGYICKKLEFSTIIGNALVDIYCKCGCLSLARRIFDEMPIKNVITWTSMVSGYVNCGQLDDARDLFERVPKRDVVLWTAMMNGYVQFNRFDEALALFREMQIKRVKPDRFTLVALLTGCAQLGALEQGKWIHGHIEENMIRVDTVLGTALMDMYAKCGCIEKSLEIFESMKERDNASWTAIICGLATNGLTSKALELFSKMKSAGAKPDAITFIGVLTACSHGGLVEEGRCYFDSMSKEHQMEPKTEHYGCMVDLFGRAGLLDEAEKLIETIPNDKFEITAPLWGALLSACRIHGNVGMGERVARRLIGVECSNSGVHTLLANMYAAADRWEDVTKVRRKMKELGVKKVPGCSSIEVNGIVHEFLVGDTSHPEMREIYSMLTDLAKPLSGLEENVIDRENMIPVKWCLKDYLGLELKL